jgi:hypothetical protein
MNYYWSLLARLMEKGKTGGVTYKRGTGGFGHRGGERLRTLEEAQAIRTMNNTFAWLDMNRDELSDPRGDVIIRHFTTDILRLTPDFAIVLTPHASVTTQARFKEYAPHHCFRQDGTLYFGSNYGSPDVLPFVLPAFNSLVVGGWTPSESERALCVAARLGSAEAHKRLCAQLASRGGPFVEMVSHLQNWCYKGVVDTRNWAMKSGKLTLRAALEAKLASDPKLAAFMKGTEPPPFTRAAPKPRPSPKTATAPNGQPFVFIMKHSDIFKCPFAIMMPEHYREDGSCKCSDAEHRKMMVKKWGYKTKQFKDIPLRES